MNIGRLSNLSGVPAKTIRYYESIRLIPEPPRTPSGYRDYNDSDVRVLRFVSKARSLGFSMKDVTQLLSLWQDRERSSAEVKALTESHIADMERRIGELEVLRQTLLELSMRCYDDTRPDSPFLDRRTS